MTQVIRSAVYTAKKHLAEQGLDVKHSHLCEVFAALLGYHTYAALVLEEADASLRYRLAEAEIYVLNVPLGQARLARVDTRPQAAERIIPACILALKECFPSTSVYASVEEFYDLHARQALAEAVMESDSVGGAMAGCNAIFADEPEMDSECPSTKSLWVARDTWTIEASGVWEGEYDPDGHRMYNGDTLICQGRLEYVKAGRAGLVLLTTDGGCKMDDSWRDQSDDLAYQGEDSVL